MILGNISYLDCLVFLVFLTPQLLLHVGLLKTTAWLVPALPFLLFKIPLQFLHERYLTPQAQRSPFVQRATFFQDLVIRCVRYAFANMPASIGRVFFSKEVSLPFTWFRMLRHGYLKCPISWVEIKRNGMKAIYIVPNPSQPPSTIIFYLHGGGFSMGSSYFYLEFLLAWLSLLLKHSQQQSEKRQGSRNPFSNAAIFSLEYSLVPDASYPTQLHQVIRGYQHALSLVQGNADRVIVAGDSAGATLILSLLLHLGDNCDSSDSSDTDNASKLPVLATLISPWTTLVSPLHHNTLSDYLDVQTLSLYGHQYAGSKVSVDDPLASPGNCEDVELWRKATPRKGWYICYGSEEVFAAEIRRLADTLQKTVGAEKVRVHEDRGNIHAWPVAALYLGETREERLRGLEKLVDVIAQSMR